MSRIPWNNRHLLAAGVGQTPAPPASVTRQTCCSGGMTFGVQWGCVNLRREVQPGREHDVVRPGDPWFLKASEVEVSPDQPLHRCHPLVVRLLPPDVNPAEGDLCVQPKRQPG